MVPRYLFVQLFFQPLLGLMVLTLRTVSVAARPGHKVLLATLGTSENSCPIGSGTTVDDGGDDLAMLDGHVWVALDIFSAEHSENIIDLVGHPTPS